MQLSQLVRLMEVNIMTVLLEVLFGFGSYLNLKIYTV